MSVKKEIGCENEITHAHLNYLSNCNMVFVLVKEKYHFSVIMQETDNTNIDLWRYKYAGNQMSELWKDVSGG